MNQKKKKKLSEFL